MKSTSNRTRDIKVRLRRKILRMRERNGWLKDCKSRLVGSKARFKAKRGSFQLTSEG